MFDQVIILINLQHFYRCSTTYRMCGIGKSQWHYCIIIFGCDLSGYHQAAQWKIAARQAFCHADHIGHDPMMFKSKPFTCSSKATHHFIYDKEYAMPVADVPYGFQI